MTVKDLLTKLNVLNALTVVNGDKELSKELKVKIVRLRMAYNKVKQQLDSEFQEFADTLLSEEEKTIQRKEINDRTSEEVEKIQKAVDRANAEYSEYLQQKMHDDLPGKYDDSFTEDDFEAIVDLNLGKDVEINNQKVTSEELVEAFYILFVDNGTNKD